MNTRIDEKLGAEYRSTDAHKAYDEMLDECYSFESVGGPFTHFRPSKVLEEQDPTAYRCGYADWLDSRSDQYYEASDGKLYTAKAVNDAADEVVDEINDEIKDLEAQLSALENEGASGDDEEDEKTEGQIEELQAKIDAINEELTDVEDSRL